MWGNVMPGVWTTKPEAEPNKEPFKAAKCDPMDFETRLKAIREYRPEKVGQYE